MSSILKIIVLTSVIAVVLSSQKVIKSLGREANLGDFYDYVRDEFLHVSAFTEDLPSRSTELIIRESQVCKARVIQSYSERNRFIQLSVTSAISAYADFFTLSGSSEIVKDFQIKSQAVNAMIIYKEQRCVHRIQLGRCSLLDIYNPLLGTSIGATHIVTGLKYGAEVSIGMHFKVEESLTKAKYQNDINMELQGYGNAVTSRSAFDLSTSDWLKQSTFESTYHGDIRVKSPLPTNFSQVVQIIEQFSQALNETRGGKGQRIYYIVKPINEVTNSLSCLTTQSTTAQYWNSSQRTDESNLEKLQRRVLRLYYLHEETAEALHAIYQEAKFHADIISSAYIQEITDMIHQFEDCKSDFSATVRKCVVEIRRNQNNDSVSEIMSAMKTFRNDTTSFAVRGKEKKIVLANKISDRNSIKNIAEYLQNGETVETYLRKYRTGRVFVFFVKEIWRVNHAEMLENGFYTLLRLGGRKVVADCDLDIGDRTCLNLDHPVIRLYVHGRLEEADVIFTKNDDSRMIKKEKDGLERFSG